MPVEVGMQAPELSLRDQHGQTVVLSEVRSAGPVVLMFYPFAFSRVCTGELAEVRDNLGSLTGAEVLAISCDPLYALRAFADRDGLGFRLLSDFWPHGEVARSYGVFDEARGCAARSTFLVDRQGLVRWTVHHALPDARHLGDLTEALAEVTE
jgi:peroxiredoxin